MQIQRRVPDVHVPQEQLNGAKVRAAFEEVRRVRMANQMGTDALAQARSLSGTTDQPSLDQPPLPGRPPWTGPPGPAPASCQAPMPSSRAAVPPRIATRSAPLKPGVLSTRSTSVLVHGNG